tara:strand:+ start:1799 stop:2395 length:597 start_codon:yes stop_codon:yes gene_type:complete
MDIRSFLFEKRSYTPIPIVLIVLFYSNPIYPYWVFGIFFIFFGELIRLHAVSHAGGRTRTTKVGAESLCTSGPYSRTRNPLYIGNLIIYSGVVLLSGGVYLIPLFFLVLFYFVFQYSMIVSLEEEKLLKLFGKDYLQYKQNVPRIIPLIEPWHNNTKREPSTFLKTLKTEKRTLQNIFLTILIISSKQFLKNLELYLN